MANTIPIQTRAVDPYTEFNSNAVNETSRAISKGTNCILSNDPIDIISDSTSPLDHVVVTSGSCIKDDVVITIISNFRVDFTDSDFYITGPPFNEAGDYYVVLDYTYVKSKPAPQASIKILKPTQRGLLTSSYLLLKVISVTLSGSFQIIGFSDYDNSIPSNKRICSQTYATIEAFLPSFDSSNDIGRIVYDYKTGISYVGNSEGWNELGSLDYHCDTSGCLLGQLVYIGGGNIAIPSISTNLATCATAFVTLIGTVGKVRMSGYVTGGRVQTGITISPGDTLYLSATEAGNVTNISPSGITQVIGTCIFTSGSDYSTVLTSMSGVEGIIYHNNTLSIQGGSLTERYHLTLSQYTNIGDGTHNQLSGTQGGTLSERYHLTLAEHNNVSSFGGNHNSIPAGLQGGIATERYHLTSAIYTAINSFGGNHNNCPDGLQGGSVSERYHLTSSQYTNIGDGTHNGLSGLQGGSATERYHLTLSQYNNIVSLPSGTRLLFAQASAPSGWTQDVTWNDRVIRVVGGAGGGTGGNWTISGLTGASHIHTTYNHTLTIDEIPPHTHPIDDALSYRGGGWSAENSNDYDRAGNSGSTGGGLPHNHGNTSTPSSTIITSTGAWRPAYLDVIVCQKN